jgi:hypothetical protein
MEDAPCQAKYDSTYGLIKYNDERLHQALGYRTPCEVFRAPPITREYVDNASALTTSPQAHHQQQERDSIELEKAL